METLRVAVVEDEAAMAQQLQTELERFGQENGYAVQVTQFADGARLVEGYRPVWDLIFLDIDMPVMDGLSAARSVRAMDPDVLLLFVTNLAQYAINGYEVGALDYILKPVNPYALNMKLKKAVRQLRSGDSKALMLKRGSDVVRVPLSRIYYIEIFNHSLRYHTADAEIEMTGAYTLAGLEKELAGHGFVRCHNCYLVNLRYVDGLHGNTLTVFGQPLAVSRNRRKAVVEALLAYAKGGSV